MDSEPDQIVSRDKIHCQFSYFLSLLYIEIFLVKHSCFFTALIYSLIYGFFIKYLAIILFDDKGMTHKIMLLVTLMYFLYD